MSTLGTAIITGASSGIGAEFARQLADRGWDLALIARRQPKLEALAAEIRARHPVHIDVLAADLAERTEIERIAARVAQMAEPGLLVHSAGFGTTGRFVRVEARKHLEMIELHLAAGVLLTHAVLPKLIERKRGALIYVASTGAFVPLPGNVTYCATKSFLVAFTESLEPEVSPAGVRVQVLCPGFTHTEFHDTPEYARFNGGSLPPMMWQSSAEVVSASLRGLDRRQRVVVPGTINRLMVGLGGLPLVGRPLRRAFVRRLMFARRS